MKRLTISLLCLTLGIPAAQALVNLGEGEITLDLRASVYYDNAIQSRADADDDFVFSAQPSLRYTRPSKNFTFSTAVGISIVRYMDASENDDENFFFDLGLSPNAEREYSRFTFSGSLTLNTQTRSEDAVGEIVTTRNYGANGSVIYDPNQNYNIIGSASWNRRDPQDDLYDEVDTTSFGLTLQVPVNKRIFAEAGGSYGETDSENDGGDSETTTYFVGLSGILLPKLTGNVSVGLQEREFDEGGSDDTPYLSAGLAWAIDERSSATLSASRSFGTTINSRSSESTSVSIGVNRQLRRDLSVNISAGYTEDNYSGLGLFEARKDQEVNLSGGISYSLARWGSLGFDIRYSNQTSTIAAFEYDRVRTGIVFNGSW